MLKKCGICDECGEENIKISDHKCSYDFIIKKRYGSIIKNENIKWDDQYKNIIKAIENGKNIIITGGGGVGKSYMIKILNEKYKIINTASSGTAAININGVTIHNLLRIFQNEKMLLKYDKSDIKYHLKNNNLETYDFICIDEISMIDGCIFDNIIVRNKFINRYRNSDIKLIIVGDCMQLHQLINQNLVIISMVVNMIQFIKIHILYTIRNKKTR